FQNSTQLPPTMENGQNLPQDNSQKPAIDYSEYYKYLLENPWVQQAIATYDWTKHSSKLLESTLDRVEASVATAAQTATQKACDAHQNYYVRPKEAVTSAYNAGVEKTMSAVETSKNVAIQGGTFGLGAAVVATQLGLALSTGGALLLLDTLGGAKNAGQQLLTSVRDAEKAVEEKIWNAVAEGQRVAQIPLDKIAESTNAFLDVIGVLVERSLGIPVEEHPEGSVKERVSVLSRKIVEALNNKAHTQVIDPVTVQLRNLLDTMSKNFLLADLIRAKKEWALEKVGELSTSVSELKTRIENEAKQYSTKPEELLMKSIRTTSTQLRDNLQALKDKQVFGDGTRVDSAIVYLQDLDKNLAESNDIYQVRDEVLSEARQRLSEVTAWTSSLLAREKQQ
uniref:Apolipoprotein b n=1 Tax=Haemonchus contortus TaxID=6289 RepID=A0A7I5E5B7_HAECO